MEALVEATQKEWFPGRRCLSLLGCLCLCVLGPGVVSVREERVRAVRARCERGVARGVGEAWERRGGGVGEAWGIVREARERRE